MTPVDRLALLGNLAKKGVLLLHRVVLLLLAPLRRLVAIDAVCHADDQKYRDQRPYHGDVHVSKGDPSPGYCAMAHPSHTESR